MLSASTNCEIETLLISTTISLFQFFDWLRRQYLVRQVVRGLLQLIILLVLRFCGLHELDRSLPQRPVPPGVTLLSLRCPQFGAFRVFYVGSGRFVSQGDSFFFSSPTEASRSKEFLANREGTAR